MEIEELKIPVPWGHIAVKTWGNKENHPVLTFHGLQDNAGTWDTLIPQLPPKFYYICPDLPSHGLSSHLPPYLPIHTVDYVLVYKIIADYFKRKDYIILAHSYGAQIGVLFQIIYPEHVSKLIMLDVVHITPISTKFFRRHIKGCHSQLIDMYKRIGKRKPPSYSYNVALQKWVEVRSVVNDVPIEIAENLLRRSLIPTENGKFQFTTDQRLRVFMNLPCDQQYITNLIKQYPVRIPMMIVLTSELASSHTYFKPMLDEMKKNPQCVVKNVDGLHNIHYTDPTLIARYIKNFLDYPKSKL